jgi:DNA polymerase III epsilon subunit-like protein
MPSDAESEAALQTPASRRKYGRRRGRIPVGDRFVSRLGPAEGEPFAAIDDPSEGGPRDRPSRQTPIEELRFVALDCETTGQSPHHLVELGAVAFTTERHLMSFETLVHSNDRINPYARRIHGIAPETLHGAPPVSRVIARFRRFVEGSVLVEHSADAFDTRLIARTVGTDLNADNLDTTRLAATLWGLRDTIGLERLCRELKVSHRKPHHALADAEATAACFLALLDLGRRELGWRTLADLLDAGQPPALRFGDEAMHSNGNGAVRTRPRRRPSRRPATSRTKTHNAD